MSIIRFSAAVVHGSKHGRAIGTPTLNVDLADVPAELQEGIYACFVTIGKDTYQAAMHYGPRIVHKQPTSCEVHLLNIILIETPEKIEIEVVKFLRYVLDFPSEEALKAQIEDDIQRTRGILSSHDSSADKTADS